MCWLLDWLSWLPLPWLWAIIRQFYSGQCTVHVLCSAKFWTHIILKTAFCVTEQYHCFNLSRIFCWYACVTCILLLAFWSSILLFECDYITFGSLLLQIRLSVVCSVHVSYSVGRNFQQYFFVILYLSYPLTSMQNFTEINNCPLGTPLFGVLNTRGVVK